MLVANEDLTIKIENPRRMDSRDNMSIFSSDALKPPALEPKAIEPASPRAQMAGGKVVPEAGGNEGENRPGAPGEAQVDSDLLATNNNVPAKAQ